MKRYSCWSRLAGRVNDGVLRWTHRIEQTGRWRLLFILLPAIIVSLFLIVPLGELAFSYATQNTRWAINGNLERERIPELPSAAKVLGHEEHYNIFHAWFDLKVSMDEKSVREYESALHFEKLVLGDKQGMARVVDDGDPELKVSNIFTERPEFVYREQLGAWWDTQSIKDGVLYRYEDTSRSPQLNIAIYVDHGRNLIYIHWDS